MTAGHVAWISSRTRLVLFDYDDTIAAARGHRQAALINIVRALGREPRIAAFEGAYGRDFRELVEAVDPGYRPETFSTFVETYRIYAGLNPAPLLPGVKALLTRLRASGTPVGIVSSSRAPIIRAELQRHDLDTAFDAIFGTDSDGPKKPDPRVIHAASKVLCQSACGPDQLYIGDSIGDWQLASRAGIGFRAVCTGVISADEFRAAGVSVEHIADDLSSLGILDEPG